MITPCCKHVFTGLLWALAENNSQTDKVERKSAQQKQHSLTRRRAFPLNNAVRLDREDWRVKVSPRISLAALCLSAKSSEFVGRIGTLRPFRTPSRKESPGGRCHGAAYLKMLYARGQRNRVSANTLVMMANLRGGRG